MTLNTLNLHVSREEDYLKSGFYLPIMGEITPSSVVEQLFCQELRRKNIQICYKRPRTLKKMVTQKSPPNLSEDNPGYRNLTNARLPVQSK